MNRDRFSATVSQRAATGVAALSVLLMSACSGATDGGITGSTAAPAGEQTAVVIQPADVSGRPSRKPGVPETRTETTDRTHTTDTTETTETDATETDTTDTTETETTDTTDTTDTTGDAGNSGEASTLHRRTEQPAEVPFDIGSQWASMEDFLYYVLVELDAYWSSVFADNGLAEPYVSYYFPAPGAWDSSACTDASGTPAVIDDTSLFYCPTSERIVVAQQMAYDIWTGTLIGPDGQQADGVIGDFAVAMVLAHEFGHHIQDELGLLNQADTPTLEQHADCLAGVWTSAAEQIGILDPGDVEEGLTAAWLVGDSAFDSADHHGTSDQRMTAFSTGYSGTGPSACDGYVSAGLA